MRLDDRAANGQSHSHAVGFSGEKSFEDTVHVMRINAGSAIFHKDQYFARGKDLRLYRQQAWTLHNGTHGIERIVKDVKQNLL